MDDRIKGSISYRQQPRLFLCVMIVAILLLNLAIADHNPYAAEKVTFWVYMISAFLCIPNIGIVQHRDLNLWLRILLFFVLGYALMGRNFGDNLILVIEEVLHFFNAIADSIITSIKRLTNALFSLAD